MKQKSIMALFLGAVLVLTLSNTEIAFADYDEDYEEESDRYDDEDHDSNHDNDESEEMMTMTSMKKKGEAELL